MPNEVQEVPSTQPQDTQVQGAQQTQDFQKMYEEASGKIKDLESKYQESSQTMSNLDAWLRADADSMKRADAWIQAQREGKKPEELWASLGPKPEVKPKKDDGIDVESLKGEIRQNLLKELQPTLETLSTAQRAQMEQAATIQMERDKAQLFKEEPWLTEEAYKEYEGRFGKKINEIASSILQNQGPFITPAQKQQAEQRATDQALMMYSHLSEKQLLHLFMDDHRSKFLTEGRRAAPKLPEGMVTDLPPGKAPQLLNQLKQKYKTVEGDGKKVAALMAEYAPQLGLSEEKVYSLVSGE